MKFSECHIFQEPLNAPFLNGLFSSGFSIGKTAWSLRKKTGKRPIKVGKRPINEGKRPIKAMVLVGISVGCLMGCFRAPPPWRKTAPLKRPIKRSMNLQGSGARIGEFLENEKSARSFSDRSFFMDVRVGCPFRNACFSRIRSVWRKSRKSLFGTFSGLLPDSRDFFQTFSRLSGAPWPGAPGDFFQTFSGFRARRARETPVNGQRVPNLSGRLRLRVQSRSRAQLRIAASIAFLFRASLKGVLDTTAPLSRG